MRKQLLYQEINKCISVKEFNKSVDDKPEARKHPPATYAQVRRLTWYLGQRMLTRMGYAQSGYHEIWPYLKLSKAKYTWEIIEDMHEAAHR